MEQTISLSKRNVQASILGWRNDCFDWLRYPSVMAAPGHDWYLKEWLETLGKRQADIARDLGWNKARISLMLRGKQPYDRDSLNELAIYLNLQPHELLMHPEDAMALRQMRKVASEIVRVPYGGRAGDEADEKRVSAA
jgi:transcriptional regulator with XRE-family HTH domain